MDKIRRWFESTYKGIWSDEMLYDPRIMKEWAEHLENIQPSMTREEIEKKVREYQAAMYKMRQEM